MKIGLLITPVIMFVLGACTTYPVQTVSNAAVNVPSTEEVTATDANTAPDAEEVATEQQAAESLDQVVCRRTKLPGTRFSKKVCMTRRAWLETSRRSRDDIKDTQRAMRQIPIER